MRHRSSTIRGLCLDGCSEGKMLEGNTSAAPPRCERRPMFTRVLACIPTDILVVSAPSISGHGICSVEHLTPRDIEIEISVQSMALLRHAVIRHRLFIGHTNFVYTSDTHFEAPPAFKWTTTKFWVYTYQNLMTVTDLC